MADPVTQEPTANEVQETIQEVQQAAVLETPAVPIEVKLATGQVYKGANHQEVIDQLVKAQEHSSAKIKEQGDSINAMQQAQLPVAEPPKEGEFDKTTYWNLWADDPMKAKAYQDGFDPVQRELQQSAEQTRKRGELDNFKATVGWTPTPEEATAFASEFARSGLEATAINLEVIYGRMVRTGAIGAATPTRPRAPVPLNRNTGVPPVVDEGAFARLPAAQMREVIEKLANG